MSKTVRSQGDRFPSIEAKVVVLGTQGVGKTSLVLRHVGNTFSRSVSPTIGASFFTFSMTINGYRIKLQLWDTAGQERFRSMAPMYYRRANAAVIVYDITREQSFRDAQEWVKELESKVEGKIALIVLGNKADLTEERQVSRERGEEFAHTLGAMFTETSASENTGVKEAFLKIAQGVITLHQKNQLSPPSAVDASYSPVNSDSRSPSGSKGHNVYTPRGYVHGVGQTKSNGKVEIHHSGRSVDRPDRKCCGIV